ncbi:hypothetical protein L1987_54550 [Smallanthus sonchifolius]|uniref:Uncharacterized protein n=1 Tax=Smallanthus sonchifolius TaxID=185202 RepID=A0ACB9E7X4_9ASTR|nr:hypothetical protein L1987_54550 [Smallanthus sonchifolius]
MSKREGSLDSRYNTVITCGIHDQRATCKPINNTVKLLHEHKGVLPKVLLLVRQIYERIDTESIVDADDARLDYFKKKVFPKIKDSVQGGIMIFISSYFEFVRV